MKRNVMHALLPALVLLSALALLAPAAPNAARRTMAAQTKYVALTFDDSPNGAVTERLLDGLRSRGAHATFFVIGEQIAGQEDLLRRMAAEGHQVGNHTFTHCRLDNSGTVGAQELARTEAALQAVLGGENYWVRPPWGFAGPETLRETTAPLIYWTLDTEDWRVLNAGQVASRIVDAVEDGDIVLLHDSYETSVDGALAAIDTLAAQGWQFVTLCELFDRAGVEPQSGCLYCRPDRLRQIPDKKS